MKYFMRIGRNNWSAFSVVGIFLSCRRYYCVLCGRICVALLIHSALRLQGPVWRHPGSVPNLHTGFAALRISSQTKLRLFKFSIYFYLYMPTSWVLELSSYVFDATASQSIFFSTVVVLWHACDSASGPVIMSSSKSWVWFLAWAHQKI